MEHEFSRLEILIGKEKLELLKNKRVAVFGIGGVGGAVCEVLSENCQVPVLRIGVMDVFGESGPAKELIVKYGLDAQSIYNKVKKFIL